MVRRALVRAVVAAAAMSGALPATAVGRVVTMTAGQTRWFLPGALAPGDRIRCLAASGAIDVVVPHAPPAGTAQGVDRFGAGGRSASVEVRPGGAAEARCGVPAHAAPHGTYPYVVGRNGLGLIHGPNTLARVSRLYGRGIETPLPSACRVVWRTIGLTARFGGSSCAGGAALTGAVVTGARWSSLGGVRVGYPLARLVWQDPTARRRSATTWLLGGPGGVSRSKLVAVIDPRGRVSRLALVRG